jgi:hypothetical protein
MKGKPDFKETITKPIFSWAARLFQNSGTAVRDASAAARKLKPCEQKVMIVKEI